MKKIFLLISLLSTVSLLAASSETLLTPLQIPAVLIGDPENRADTASGGRGLGSVTKNFLIGKYEVTASQYCTFLNAVASQGDPHHLYKKEMGTDPQIACITQTQLPNGTYIYDLIEGREKIPITYVSLRDAQRFCNWLEHDCPASEEDLVLLAASTETGAYEIFQQGDREFVEWNQQAHYYIPTENEWVKAAYYKGEGIQSGYWTYPTQHDWAPNNGHGDVSNQANYATLASHWQPPEKSPVLTPVDDFSQTYSFYGACDMGGNVEEWTDNVHEEGSLDHTRSPAIVRGGSWKSQYSIWWNNELNRTTLPSSYDPLTANNFIGFRIATTVEPSSQHGEICSDGMNSMDHDSLSHVANSDTSSFVLWTCLKGLLFGCPRTMICSLFSYFGYDAATVLGVNIASMSLKLMAVIAAMDIAGYIVVMALLYGAYYLIPWTFLKNYILGTLYSLSNLL